MTASHSRLLVATCTSLLLGLMAFATAAPVSAETRAPDRAVTIGAGVKNPPRLDEGGRITARNVLDLCAKATTVVASDESDQKSIAEMLERLSEKYAEAEIAADPSAKPLESEVLEIKGLSGGEIFASCVDYTLTRVVSGQIVTERDAHRAISSYLSLPREPATEPVAEPVELTSSTIVDACLAAVVAASTRLDERDEETLRKIAAELKESFDSSAIRVADGERDRKPPTPSDHLRMNEVSPTDALHKCSQYVFGLATEGTFASGNEAVAFTSLLVISGEEDPKGETEPTDETQPTDETPPTDETLPTDETPPSDDTEPTNDTQPTEEVEPTDGTEPTDDSEPVDETEPADETVPTEETDPAGGIEPADETRETEETDVPAQTVTPAALTPRNTTPQTDVPEREVPEDTDQPGFEPLPLGAIPAQAPSASTPPPTASQRVATPTDSATPVAAIGAERSAFASLSDAAANDDLQMALPTYVSNGIDYADAAILSPSQPERSWPWALVALIGVMLAGAASALATRRARR